MQECILNHSYTTNINIHVILLTAVLFILKDYQEPNAISWEPIGCTSFGICIEYNVMMGKETVLDSVARRGEAQTHCPLVERTAYGPFLMLDFVTSLSNAKGSRAFCYAPEV